MNLYSVHLICHWHLLLVTTHWWSSWWYHCWLSALLAIVSSIWASIAMMEPIRYSNSVVAIITSYSFSIVWIEISPNHEMACLASSIHLLRWSTSWRIKWTLSCIFLSTTLMLFNYFNCLNNFKLGSDRLRDNKFKWK